MELNSVNRAVKSNFRVLAIPLFATGALVILFVLLGKFGYSKVASQMTELKSSEGSERSLEGKLEVLQRVEADLRNSTDETSLALPNRNSAPPSLSNIKSNASSNFVVINNVSMSSSSEGGDPSKVDIDLSISGDNLVNFIEYLKSFENVAPITLLESAGFGGGDTGKFGISLTLSSYWSAFPETIPSVSAPVLELTKEEQELMDKIGRLTRPSFENLLPSQPSVRENPFN